MMRIDRSIVIQCAPEAVFAIVSDPMRWPGLFSGLTRLERVSETAGCVGARYLMLIQVGSVDAGSVVCITDWRAPERLGWKSEQGVVHTGSVTLTAAHGGSTDVRIELAYSVPGPRIAASFVERMTRHIVDRRVHATLLSTKRVAEFDSEISAHLDRPYRRISPQPGARTRARE